MTFSERAVEAAAKAICLEQFGNEIVHGEARCCQVGGTEGCCVEAVREQAEKALAAALAVDGLALVPKKPTDAVLRAGYEAWVDDKYDGSQAPLMCAVWTAMLTAASDGEVG